MKNLVIYQTNTGFTKKYADWIAQQLNCEAKPVDSITSQELAQAELVVYGGWISANAISGFSKFRKLRPDHMVVFAVGAAPAETVDMEALATKNQLTNVPLFYFRGGICFEKMSFAQRTLLKMFKASLEKKAVKTDEENGIENALAHSYDATDEYAVTPLVNYCRKVIG